MRNNIYEFDGKEFHSIKELAKYSGINEKTITARIRRGMTITEACSNADLRCKYYSYDGQTKSIISICRDENKDSSLIRNRLKYGYSIDKALNKPKKICKQGKPIIVDGVLYNSIAEACRRRGVEDKENTIRSRLRLGMSVDQAFDF